MTRAAVLIAAVVLLTTCGEVGLTVDVSAKSDVPEVEQLRVEVTQGPVLVEQTFGLGAKKLPQSVAIVSKGLTRGSVDITVQGLAGGRVVGVARVGGELKAATGAMHIAAVLERLCLPGAPTCGCSPSECNIAKKACGLKDDGCGGHRDCGSCAAPETCSNGGCTAAACTPKTCAELGATCGLELDGCGGTLDCGLCDAGLNCGGGGVANVCGPGTCTPRTACDAGLECGTQGDGCGRLLTCGTCDGGATCGANNRCPCVPLTQCPMGRCGQWPNGCGTGTITCPTTCTLPNTCGGGGQANTCGCTAQTVCPALACGQQPNGCGGTLGCPFTCSAGRTCSSLDGGPTRCNCTFGQTECDGGCVDLATSSTNCGACGRACPLGQGCSGGKCPCVDAGSNLDGHCCPPGWFLSPYVNSSSVRCFKGPFDAGNEMQGIVQCRAETAAGFGLAVSALGAAQNNQSTSVPANACGSFLVGRNNQVIDVETGMFTTTTLCSGGCSGTLCHCTTCACSGANRACDQRYYCVMDPLGPTVEGPCQQPGQCPPGATCFAGACVDAGTSFCSIDSDCSLIPNCLNRNNSQTGLCQ